MFLFKYILVLAIDLTNIDYLFFYFSVCELFVKNNTNPINELEECWFVFLVYCGYPKALYNETSCYSVRNYRVTA